MSLYFYQNNSYGLNLSQFEKYNFAPDTVSDTITGMKATPGESIESLAERLENLLKDKLQRKK